MTAWKLKFLNTLNTSFCCLLILYNYCFRVSWYKRCEKDQSVSTKTWSSVPKFVRYGNRKWYSTIWFWWVYWWRRWWGYGSVSSFYYLLSWIFFIPFYYFYICNFFIYLCLLILCTYMKLVYYYAGKIVWYIFLTSSLPISNIRTLKLW